MVLGLELFFEFRGDLPTVTLAEFKPPRYALRKFKFSVLRYALQTSGRNYTVS